MYFAYAYWVLFCGEWGKTKWNEYYRPDRHITTCTPWFHCRVQQSVWGCCHQNGMVSQSLPWHKVWTVLLASSGCQGNKVIRQHARGLKCWHALACWLVLDPGRSRKFTCLCHCSVNGLKGTIPSSLCSLTSLRIGTDCGEIACALGCCFDAVTGFSCG